ncbi:HupE/UreJ family protein [uncultured Eudoraea sp.]|uniref:HupE/UreJ family protein n=1 Tax=uncultured Eudoraea sp. TaxID=1035614 RepID=UPI0026334BD0|nr:HupE/UreJ family protein [uncultured Eudoraea sp.]
MYDFWFYCKLGINHVLDWGAYDHVLFLSALAAPFTFKHWKKVVVLATLFTIAHCLSLLLSVYDIVNVDVELVEFLIPLTILLTAIFNIVQVFIVRGKNKTYLLEFATTFFGIIHGFGFSNYFNMLMSEEEEKIGPLLGFASGIEISQIIIIFSILTLAFVMQNRFGLKRSVFTVFISSVIVLLTIPMLINSWPW